MSSGFFLFNDNSVAVANDMQRAARRVSHKNPFGSMILRESLLQKIPPGVRFIPPIIRNAPSKRKI